MAGVAGRPVRVVLVTGSSGFLGQHVVRLLQEDQPTVKEIRLMDIRPFENNLGHRTDKPMRETVGSVCDVETLMEAFIGVDCVIHCASLIDVRFFKDVKAMEAVNVQGTQNVIEACILQKVPYLVFTGSVTAEGACSTGAAAADHCYPGPYPKTKLMAEKLVLAANGRFLADGPTQLRTVVLRQLPLYGEQEKINFTQFLRVSKVTRGTFLRIGSSRLQTTYVGNAAAAHLHAMHRLARDADVSGQAFTVTDDTPTDGIQFMLPFARSRGLSVSRFAVPYSVALAISVLVMLVLTLLRPLYNPTFQVASPSDVRYVYRAPFFDGSRARTVLGFQPRFSVEDALRMSMPYYQAVQL